MKIKNFPNVITAMRIVFSPILLCINPFTPLFLIIYVICGLSDVLDGYLARRNKMTGFILFCFPLLYFSVGIMITSYIICVCASISAIEELFINLLTKKLSLDTKSIFHSLK